MGRQTSEVSEDFGGLETNAATPKIEQEVGDLGTVTQENKNYGGDQNIINQPGTVIIHGQEKPVRPRNEQLLLQQVREEVDSRLAQSLHNAVLINLGKQVQPNQVNRPWDTEVKIGSKPATPLPAETAILEVFERPDIARKLLILGEPGAGKTTTMLDLATALVQKATTEPNEPIPVLLNLSSWKDPKLKMQDWLVAELKSKYGVRQDIGQQWLAEKQLLPLLDGLDEVKPEHQESCVVAINQWLEDETRPLNLLVCSRREEYANYTTNLQLNGAILLRSLTHEQLEHYLSAINQSALWQTLNQDAALLELVKTPLLLSITILSYEELSLTQWHQIASTEKRLELLLDVYVQKMLHREMSVKVYRNQQAPSAKQTRRWLIALARKLKYNSQTEFLIEEIQLDWLQNSVERRIYRLILGLVLGLIGGLIGGLIDETSSALAIGLAGGLIFGLISGLIFEQNSSPGSKKAVGLQLGSILGLISGLVGGLSFEPSGELINGLIVGLNNKVISELIVGIFLGISGGLSFQVSFGLNGEMIFGLIGGAIGALSGGLFGGMIGGIFGGLIGGLIDETTSGTFRRIQPLEKLRWSWQKFFKNGLFIALNSGLIAGVLGALISLTIGSLVMTNALDGGFSLNGGSTPDQNDVRFLRKDSIFRDGITVGVVLGISSGMISGFSRGFSGGLSAEIIDQKNIPNQGIRRSILHFILSGLLLGSFLGLFFGMSNGLISIWHGVLSGGLIGSLSGGGIACIQHLTLRLFLYLNETIPWNYARFLNYSTDRLLLQRIGGRYRFIHKLLQDHFAAMPLERE